MRINTVIAALMISLAYSAQAIAQDADALTAFRPGDVITLPRVGSGGLRGAMSVTPVNPNKVQKVVPSKTCIVPASAEMVVVAVNAGELDGDLLVASISEPTNGSACGKCTLFFASTSDFKPITEAQRLDIAARKYRDDKVRSLVRKNGGTVSSEITPPFANCIF